MFKKLSKIVLWVSGGLFAIGLLAPSAVILHISASDYVNCRNGNCTQGFFGVHFIQASLFLFFGWWLIAGGIALGVKYHRAVQGAVDDAIRPIPTLGEIDQQLRAEGYVPSVQDCIAVEQHLKSNRNEALLTVGALTLGVQALSRTAQGKPLL